VISNGVKLPRTSPKPEPRGRGWHWKDEAMIETRAVVEGRGQIPEDEAEVRTMRLRLRVRPVV